MKYVYLLLFITTITMSQEQFPIKNHSFASSDTQVKHLDLDIQVDFTNKVISGIASYQIDRKNDSKQLVLDINGLKINKVTFDNNAVSQPFTLGPIVEHLGQALAIKLKANVKTINVHYQTTEKSQAVQWLSSMQTAEKKHPFMFTQSWAILARTWIPCQDNPEVRITYSAKVKVPKQLLALMSAENPIRKNSKGIYNFKMKQPVPMYLIALAVGDLSFKKLDSRTGIYAEPLMLKKAAKEFSDLPKMVKTAEKLYGPYLWDRQDLLIMPPSFPYGGMENPRLSFINPTVIAGDKSRTNIIAHELAHSWSGNLVTNETWEDFWLNEGFTVYFERRITESMYGSDTATMKAKIGIDELKEAMKKIESSKYPEDNRLFLNLKNRNPEDGLTVIPYEKGFYFLKTLENIVGRKQWDAFLKKYFAQHAFQTMSTSKFISLLDKEFIQSSGGLGEKIQINEWVYGQSIPSNAKPIQSQAFVQVDQQLNRWKEGTLAQGLDTQGWVSEQWIHFINNLPEQVEIQKLEDLDQAFNFSESGNVSILSQWFVCLVRNQHAVQYPKIRSFLLSTGHLWHIYSVYAEMIKNQKTQQLALDIFSQAKASYHPITVRALQELFQ